MTTHAIRKRQQYQNQRIKEIKGKRITSTFVNHHLPKKVKHHPAKGRTAADIAIRENTLVSIIEEIIKNLIEDSL